MGLLKRRSNIISFHNCISAVKKFAEDNGADTLTSLLTIQTWIAETKLKTKLSLFLPMTLPFTISGKYQRDAKTHTEKQYRNAPKATKPCLLI